MSKETVYKTYKIFKLIEEYYKKINNEQIAYIETSPFYRKGDSIYELLIEYKDHNGTIITNIIVEDIIKYMHSLKTNEVVEQVILTAKKSGIINDIFLGGFTLKAVVKSKEDFERKRIYEK